MRWFDYGVLWLAAAMVLGCAWSVARGLKARERESKLMSMAMRVRVVEMPRYVDAQLEQTPWRAFIAETILDDMGCQAVQAVFAWPSYDSDVGAEFMTMSGN